MQILVAAFVFLMISHSTHAAVRTHIVDDVAIDGVYPAMSGPVVDRFVDMKGLEGDVWVTGIKVMVLKENKDSPQYICHSRLIVAPVDAPAAIASNNGAAKKYGKSPLLAISQGQNEVQLPRGFGLKVETEGGARGLLFGIQLQNHEKIEKSFIPTVKADISYFTDKEAKARRLRPLFPTRFTVTHERDRHWHVPSGRHVFTTRYWPKVADGKGSTVRIHYMRLHLHAFATEFEFYDLTAKKSLWKAKASTDVKNELLSHVDHFTSEAGLLIDVNHSFELRAIYDNPTEKPIDAMAYLTMFTDRSVMVR